MEEANLSGQMDLSIKETFSIITLRAKENISGQMVGLMWENGRIIKCMDMVYLHGQMEEDMKGLTLKIRNKGKVSSIGQMEGGMKENG